MRYSASPQAAEYSLQVPPYQSQGQPGYQTHSLVYQQQVPSYQTTPYQQPPAYNPYLQQQGQPVNMSVPPGGAAGGVGVQQASAPAADKMDIVPGYENIGFTNVANAPPSYEESVGNEAPPMRTAPQNIPTITEEQAREALLDEISNHCCWGKKAAQHMIVRDIRSSSAFHYTLETFTEKRETSWAYEPFTGQPIDSPASGPAPGPWDIQAHPQSKFKNGVAHIEVPHTASVKPCHECVGIGRTRCRVCLGQGMSQCSHCRGSGHNSHHHEHHGHHGGHHGHHGGHHCTWCEGSGRKRCDTCLGHGQSPCSVCNARGNLKCYIRLTVTWTNHYDDHIVERTSLPDELVRGVTGQLAFEEELPHVWPINHFPDQIINTASRQLVDRHRSQFVNEQMLMQRHKVRIVPVSEVLFSYKDKEYGYHVYGYEKKVHAPKYPQQCCCGCCTII